MATNLGTAYVRIEPSAKGIGNEISNVLNSEAGSAGTMAGSKIASGISASLKTGLGATAAATGVAVAGVVALGKSITEASKASAEYGDNVDKLSQKIGISAGAFQEWDYIFSQNGADISILETGMKTLSSAVYDASVGSKSAIEKFNALGLSVEDLKGKTQEDIFSTVIARLQEMPESAERTALAADVLGKSAMELQPLLNQTAESTDALKQQAHDLGMVMSDEAVKNAAAFTDSMDNLTRAFEGAKNKIGAEFMPSLTEITNGLANLIAGNEGAQESIVNGFASMGESITNAIPAIVDTFSTLVVSIAEIAPEIITTLGTGLISALPEIFPAVITVITSLAQAFIENLPMIITVGIQLIGDLVIGIAQALPELIPAAIEAIYTIVDSLLDNIDLLIDAAVELAIGIAVGLVQAIPVIVEKAPLIISKLVIALVGAIPKLVLAAGQLMTAFLNAILNMGAQLAGAGRQIVDGLKNGIVNAWGNLVNKVKEMASNLVNSVKNVFKISSPSKVFAQIGDYCVQGFDNSFDSFGDSALTSVEDAMHEMAGVAVPTFETDMSVRPGSYKSVANNNSDLYGLLAQYLPMLENGLNANVVLEGDADGLFRVVRQKTNQFTRSTGASPFVVPAGG